MTPEDAVAQAVAFLGSWEQEPRDNAFIESVERVLVDGQPGLVLLWAQTTYDQGLRRFGLLTTGEKIINRQVHLDSAIDDLRLLVVEPHGTTADHETRTWFCDV